MKLTKIPFETNLAAEAHKALPMSRRNWLRSTALTATGAAVLPALLNSCIEDHRIPPALGGAEELTPEQLVNAALSLKNMQIWFEALTARNNTEVFHVYTLVKGGEVPPTTFQEVFVDIVVKIGFLFLEAAVEEIPFAGAAVAIAAKEIEKWGEEKGGNNVDATFGELTGALKNIQDSVDDRLSRLQDPKDNYGTLREAFKDGGSIEFNGKKHTLSDLAQEQNIFPVKASNDYADLIESAHLGFRKSFWNALILQAGEVRENWVFWHDYPTYRSPREVVRLSYEQNPDDVGSYFRGYLSDAWGGNYVNEYAFVFDNKKLNEFAVKELFIDDVRGSKINEGALFYRDYVYKQFHAKKYDFGPYHDVSLPGSDQWDDSDYEFTGGPLNKPK